MSEEFYDNCTPEEKELIGKAGWIGYEGHHMKVQKIIDRFEQFEKDIMELAQGLKQLGDWCKNMEIRITQLEVK